MPGRIAEILKSQHRELVEQWVAAQRASSAVRSDLISDAELRQECLHLLELMAPAAQQDLTISSAAWSPVRDMLADLSRSRAQHGFTPSETATFVLSLKQPLFNRLRAETGTDADALGDEVWAATTLIDGLALLTTDAFIRTREEVVIRQQQELIELSTPVVKLWEGVLALPLIGTLDSARTQVVMENLLQMIVDTGAEIAIIDITGVPTVDTLVAQHLLRTVAAARLMGADCIISGIRPQIAQTIVHLGVDLANVITKASLADAFVIALRRTGASLVPNGKPEAAHASPAAAVL